MSNLLDIGDQEIHNLAVVGKLPPRQHHLIRAFLVELAQPGASCVRIHRRYPKDPSNDPNL
jgi:hypothetical protein